jgi:hypothetical protein
LTIIYCRIINSPFSNINYRKLKKEDKLVGKHVGKLLHLANTTTNRVEGMHADIKRNLKASSFAISFSVIDKWYREKTDWNSIILIQTCLFLTESFTHFTE